MTSNDYVVHADLLFHVMKRSSPLIRAYIINKFPLLFQEQAENMKFVALFPELDLYSKSVFIERITDEKRSATVLLPLMKARLSDFDNKQLKKYLSAYQNFEIPGYLELREKLKDRSK